MPQQHLPKPSWGSCHSKELLRYREELFHPCKGGKDLGSNCINGHAQVSCRLRGHEIRLLVVYHKPPESDKVTSSFRTCCLATASEKARTSQSVPGITRSRIPRVCAQADTLAANTRVKTWGAVDSPKHRTLNFYRLLQHETQ